MQAPRRAVAKHIAPTTFAARDNEIDATDENDASDMDVDDAQRWLAELLSLIHAQPAPDREHILAEEKRLIEGLLNSINSRGAGPRRRQDADPRPHTHAYAHARLPKPM